ncbi:MAG TPA: hypothetical protein VE783_10285 [Candidatus Limnocylindrales bacterium]|nr:hypothetical protein [Candidatus Limnocylindrales bacterium]
MESRSSLILCVADSNLRLQYLARAVKKAGCNFVLSNSAHNAVAMAAITNELDAAVLDEDMVLGEGSVAESIKAVKSLPILLVCDAGPTGPNPAGVDLITANGSRQQIAAALHKLLQPRVSTSRVISR